MGTSRIIKKRHKIGERRPSTYEDVKHPVKVDEVLQNILDDWIIEGISFDPAEVRRYGVKNIFTRTLAHLIGKTKRRSLPLECTEAGILKVATAGAGFEYSDTKSGAATDAYGTALQFDEIASKVHIWIWDNPAILKWTFNGIAWMDEFELRPGTYSLEMTVHSMNIKNKTAGMTANYQILGQW